MKAKVISIDSKINKALDSLMERSEGIIVEAETLILTEGCYFFGNTDRTNPELPIKQMVAVFPIDKFYIIRQE